MSNDKKRRLEEPLGADPSPTRKRALQTPEGAAKRRAVQSPSGDAVSRPCQDFYYGWFQELLLSQCSDSIRKELVDLITSLTEGQYDGYVHSVGAV